jgi:integrase
MAGSIRRIERRDGPSYVVRVEYPPDPATGERRQRSKSYRTKKEAEKALAAWRTEIDRGLAVEPDRLTVAGLFEHWLESFRGSNPKERTIVEYERTIRAKIIPGIGAVPVQQLRPLQIDAFYAQLREAGASSDAIHRVHKRLRQALDYAAKKRLIAASPLAAVDPPTVRSRAPVVLTPPQLRHFLRAAAADGYSPLWLLIVQTGLRRGEALGLRWQDIDLARRRLQVRQCVEVLRGAAHLTTPKTPAALRSVTLFAESVTALAAHRERQAERRRAAGAAWRDHDLVFSTPEGGPINPNNVLRNLAVIVRRGNAADGLADAARLPRFSLHDLRHTHATHLLTEGWPVAVVSRRLGHANPAITLQLYAHAIADVHGEDVATPAAFALDRDEAANG